MIYQMWGERGNERASACFGWPIDPEQRELAMFGIVEPVLFLEFESSSPAEEAFALMDKFVFTPDPRIAALEAECAKLKQQFEQQLEFSKGAARSMEAMQQRIDAWKQFGEAMRDAVTQSKDNGDGIIFASAVDGLKRLALTRQRCNYYRYWSERIVAALAMEPKSADKVSEPLKPKAPTP